jgi:hypothetical protein
MNITIAQKSVPLLTKGLFRGVLRVRRTHVRGRGGYRELLPFHSRSRRQGVGSSCAK